MNDLHVASQTLAPQTSERRALLRALRALQKGDFTVRMPLDMSGSDREVAQAFNDVVEMNQSIADELARICRDVGRAGQINQRMRIAAAVGSWASQVDSVNELIGDLVRPTAAVAHVIKSGGTGALSQRWPRRWPGAIWRRRSGWAGTASSCGSRARSTSWWIS